MFTTNNISHIKKSLESFNLPFNDKISKDLYTYYSMLLQWNNKINLTSITTEKEVIDKHFIDSILPVTYFDFNNKSVIDIGSGAGFPGIPISLFTENSFVCLLDSLNKRINFLNEVIDSLEINNIEAIHGRCEHIAHTSHYRESFDISTSRAVAPLNVLLELSLPFVKVSGYFVALKSQNINAELAESESSINILGGKLEDVINYTLPDTDISRSLVIIKKVSKTDPTYPRKPKKICNQPL